MVTVVLSVKPVPVTRMTVPPAVEAWAGVTWVTVSIAGCAAPGTGPAATASSTARTRAKWTDCVEPIGRVLSQGGPNERRAGPRAGPALDIPTAASSPADPSRPPRSRRRRSSTSRARRRSGRRAAEALDHGAEPRPARHRACSRRSPATSDAATGTLNARVGRDGEVLRRRRASLEEQRDPDRRRRAPTVLATRSNVAVSSGSSADLAVAERPLRAGRRRAGGVVRLEPAPGRAATTSSARPGTSRRWSRPAGSTPPCRPAAASCSCDVDRRRGCWPARRSLRRPSCRDGSR